MPVNVLDKLTLTDQAADPSSVGDIQRNGDNIKFKNSTTVVKLGTDAKATVTIGGVSDTLENFVLLGMV